MWDGWNGVACCTIFIVALRATRGYPNLLATNVYEWSIVDQAHYRLLLSLRLLAGWTENENVIS